MKNLREVFEMTQSGWKKVEGVRRQLTKLGSEAQDAKSHLESFQKEILMLSNREFIAGAQKTVSRILNEPDVLQYVEWIFKNKIDPHFAMFKKEVHLKVSLDAPKPEETFHEHHNCDVIDGRHQNTPEYHLAIRFHVRENSIQRNLVEFDYYELTVNSLDVEHWHSVLPDFDEERLIRPLLYFQREQTALQWLLQMYGTNDSTST